MYNLQPCHFKLMDENACGAYLHIYSMCRYKTYMYKNDHLNCRDLIM